MERHSWRREHRERASGCRRSPLDNASDESPAVRMKIGHRLFGLRWLDTQLERQAFPYVRGRREMADHLFHVERADDGDEIWLTQIGLELDQDSLGDLH